MLREYWDYKTLWIGIGLSDVHLKGLNFEFLLSFVFLFMLMVTWGLLKGVSFWSLKTFVETHVEDYDVDET